MDALQNTTVTLFGGTGHYGKKITEKLLNKGITVKILSRDIMKARNIIGEKGIFIEGNVKDREKVTEALEGSDSVIVSISAMSWKQIKKIQEIEVNGLKIILEECSRLNIQRLVFISVYDIRENFVEEHKSEMLADTKVISERLLRESALNWTILGCPPSYELFFRLLRNRSLNVPGGGRKPIVCISPDDVGEIAAQAILRKDLSGKRFRLAGPEVISFPLFAQKVSFITGQTVNLREIPLGLINVITRALLLINPFPRLIYKALIMMNHFPSDMAARAKDDHDLIMSIFHFVPTTIDDEIRRRYNIRI